MNPCAPVCDVLGAAVEVYGELQSAPETGAMQRQALADISALLVGDLVRSGIFIYHAKLVYQFREFTHGHCDSDCCFYTGK